ncbi:MAG TPA: cell division protein FtsW, partial [Bacteroidales bacterium]|nr:cell division protein FtsW [Bacteroidales bacterium]
MGSIVKNIRGDKVIWAVVILLSVFSVLAVYSSTGTLAYRFKQGNTEYYLIKHLSIMGLGLVLMYLAHLIPYHYFGRLSKFAIIAVIPLLAYTLLFGTSVHGASRWHILPIINLSFQPSDIAKLALIVYLSYALAKMQSNIDDLNNMLVKILLPTILIVALVFPANLSTAVIIFATSLIIMFVGRVRLIHLGGIAGGSLILLLTLILIIQTNPNIGRFQTWETRINSYVGSNEENNYQIEQSKIAIATGGITGKLPGNSTQKNFLPQSFSDFIYAIIIEEYGLAGGVVIVLLYMILLFRGIRIATKSEDIFGSILTFGLVFSLVFQAMINMGVAVGLMPVTGQPLPMVS